VTAHARVEGFFSPSEVAVLLLLLQVEALGFHVLFVDDDPVNRRLGGRMLQRLGCTCHMLEDGDQV
jgi:hypothetical protein